MLAVQNICQVTQQDSWIRCPSSYPPLNNSNLASTHRQKCLCENCGSLHHRAMEPRRVLPTMCLIILVSAVDSAVICELAPNPRSYGPKAHGEQWLRQSPTGKRAFVEIQSSGKVPAQGYSKKFWVWMHWGEEDEQSDFTHATPLPRRWSSVPRELLVIHDFSHVETWEHVSEWLAFWAVQDAAKDALFLPHPGYWVWAARLEEVGRSE